MQLPHLSILNKNVLSTELQENCQDAKPGLCPTIVGRLWEFLWFTIGSHLAAERSTNHQCTPYPSRLTIEARDIPYPERR